MTSDRKRPARVSSRAKRLQLQGARQGGQLVKSEFSAALTRRRYCELVGIHMTTLRRWEAVGIVCPERRRILNSPTLVFSPEDVTFGKRLIALLRSRHGEISLDDAARIVRKRQSLASKQQGAA